MLSRIIYGARISLTIGLIGITFSFMLGIVIGGLAGYHGGVFDLVVQRIIEVLQSIPSIPLWMALAAIMPVTWSPILIYFGITLILGLLDWTGLARAVRSKLLSLREEDYVLAAQLMGARPSRIIGRHLVPGFMSHLIATATIAIPGMILGETALSFLGLGLRPPITSWGILLTEARSVSVIAFYPWLLLPDDPGDPGHPRLQLPGRRPARRGRSVSVDEHERPPALSACAEDLQRHAPSHQTVNFKKALHTTRNAAFRDRAPIRLRCPVTSPSEARRCGQAHPTAAPSRHPASTA